MKAKQLLWKLSLVFVSMLFVLATALGLLNYRETKTVKASSGSVSVYMLDGASIRYDGENSGIRFTAYVSDSSFSSGADVTVGMTITSGSKTWERTSDADTWQWATSDVAGYKKFQVALTGIPDTDYGTDLTATAWVDVDGVKTEATAQTRSIARVANACLAENELLKEIGSEETLTDTKVSTLDGYTTGEALASVSEIEMSNNSFVWSEIANATGYFVGFSGEVLHVIGGASVPVSAFGKIATPVDGVSVIAYGNGVDNTYGEVVSGSVLFTELANFSDADNGTVNYVQGVKNNQFREAPAYADGVVSFATYLDSYDNTWSVNLSAFQVELPTGLDLSKDGIVVRVNINGHSGTVSPTHVALLPNVDKAEWDAIDDITTLPNAEFTAKGTWMELKVSSADLDTLGYENGDTTLSFGGWVKTAVTQNGGGAAIWYQLDDISYYSGGFSLETPTDLAVSNKGLITWSEVANADGYTVDIDGTQYETTTNRYQMDEFTADVTVRVQAMSNGEFWADSLWSETFATDYFTLASFADANNGTVSYIEGNRADKNTWKLQPDYATNPGSVRFGVYVNNYDTSSNVASSLIAFKVNLSKGLDLSFDGIEILANSNGGSNVTLSAFSILKKGDNANWCTTNKSTLPNVAISPSEWVTLQITSAQLVEMGYANGDTELYLGVWLSQTYALYAGYQRTIQLDEIRHYAVPTLLTPENVTVSDTGLIEWTAVNNADGYVVEIDGTEYTSDNNSYQIQAFAKDVTVRVRAISNGEYWTDSPWTEEVTTDCFMLADFSDTNNGTISGLEGKIFGTAPYRTEPSYEDGTVKVGIKLDRYHSAGGNTQLAAFKVTLPTGLDLTKGGIVVRVQLYSKSSSVDPEKFTLLTKDGQSAWQNGSSADFPGVTLTLNEWLEVKLSSAELQSMGYATGDTELYFGGWTTSWLSPSANNALGMWFQLDEILYYTEYTADELAEQIAYDGTKTMEFGAYIAPTSALLANSAVTAHNPNNIYQAAGLNSFNIVVNTSSTFEGGVGPALTRCGWAQIDTYIQLHNDMTESVDGWTKFQEIFSGVDLTEYSALKGFFIADEPSWTQMEIIETYYVPWFNENYAKSGLEFYVNLFGAYSTGIGELRDINGNSLDKYEGSEEEYRDCYTVYVNEWLRIYATVKSSNKYLTLDSYPLMDNQTGLLTEFDGSNLPAEGYERVLYSDWLRRSMNMANFARDNGHTFGAFIQAFDEGGEGSNRTYRLPTKVEEIKWQAYMNIALGAKRLTYYGFDARTGGHYMTASGAQPTAIYYLVQETNAELATLDHVFMAFDTWVGAKTFIPSGATASEAIAGVADIELNALTNVSGVTTSGELVVGEMVDNHGNHGYMLVGYNDPFNGVSTSVSMTFDGADGFIVYRAGENVRTFVESADGLLSLTLGAGEGVFVIPVYAK